ncbi:MAG: MBL fold metallo-hydrolase, partial [Pseudomonadota bacterium]
MNKSFMVPGEGGALEVIPFLVNHGPINALGFRIGPLAYSPDLVGLPEPSFDVLDGVECWIVDALRYTPHVSHAHLELTLSWLERVRPRLGILTNLHVDLDYQTLKGELQPGIIPAYDGLVIRL